MMMQIYLYIITFIVISLILYILRQRFLSKRMNDFLSWMTSLSNQRNLPKTDASFSKIVLDIRLINDIFLSKELPVDISTLLLEIVKQVESMQLPIDSIAVVNSARIDGTDIKVGVDILSIGDVKNGS